MDSLSKDPMVDIAEQLADYLAERGYAFIEDDKIDMLAGFVASFLRASGISVTRRTVA